MKIAGLFAVPIYLDPRLDPDPEEGLGIGYVLAAARAQGHEVRLFTPLDGEAAALYRLILTYHPDILAISLFTCSLPDSVIIAREVRRRIPSIKIVVGGPHATSTPDIAMQPEFDYVVRGEGEETFCDLLRALENGEDMSCVRGIVFEESGRLVSTAERARIADLDALKYPVYDRRYYDLPAHSLSFPTASSVKYAPMIFSRGCSMNCSFCSSREIWGRNVLSHSPESVIAEICHLQTTYGVNYVFFEDLTFAGDRDGMRALCRHFADNLKGVSWGCETCVDSVTREDLALMKAAGCSKIIWGIESLDVAILQGINKQQSQARIRRVLEMSADLGILNWGTYMIGFPEETEASIRSTSRELQNMDIHQLRISIATPFPGSEWYSKISKSALHPDLRLYDTNHLVYDHSSISAKRMKELQNELFVRFYGSREYRDRLGRMIHLHPHLRESVDEWLAYIDTNIEKLAGGTVELTQTLEWQEVQRSYNPLQPVDEPKCKSTKGELEVALRI
ncbi:MAG: radical SAM protein [bacterium]